MSGIQVKYINNLNKQSTFTTEIAETDTIKNIKNRLCKLTGVDANIITLFKDNKVLQDNKTCKELGIIHDVVLNSNINISKEHSQPSTNLEDQTITSQQIDNNIQRF
jgi:hypothetical protein